MEKDVKNAIGVNSLRQLRLKEGSDEMFDIDFFGHVPSSWDVDKKLNTANTLRAMERSKTPTCCM